MKKEDGLNPLFAMDNAAEVFYKLSCVEIEQSLWKLLEFNIYLYSRLTRECDRESEAKII